MREKKDGSMENTDKLEVIAFNEIVLRLRHKEKNYSFNLSHGSKIDDAIEACGCFITSLSNIRAKEEKNNDSSIYINIINDEKEDE